MMSGKVIFARLGIGVLLSSIVVCIVYWHLMLGSLVDKNNMLLSGYEICSLIISTILAILTLITVAVALFKEDITRLWRRVRLTVVSCEQELFKEQLIEVSGNSTAESYCIPMMLRNDGSIDARNCRIHITKITHTNQESGNTHVIEVKQRSVVVDSSDSQVLVPLSCLHFNLIELRMGKSQGPVRKGGNSQSKHSTLKPTLLVSGTEIHTDYHKGTLKVDFAVHCDGISSLQHSIVLRWNGEWKNRLVDICPDNLSAELIIGGK